MPGIFGFVRKGGGKQEDNEALLRGMLYRLAHNPHYVSQIHAADWFGLGNIGLPIPGEQRMVVDDSGRYTAAFSGYIYGWKNVGSEEEQEIPDKAAHLIKIYERYGHDLPDKIDGSFNAAIFDSSRREAIICNDRFGHRQLYYFEDAEIFLFSTEVKAFLAYEKFPRDINFDAVADYFNYGYPLGNKTFFRNVDILQGGQEISIKDGRVGFRHYWDYQFGEESKESLNALIEEADAIYRELIRKRISQGGRIVIPLSGGLDSRFIISHTVQAGLQPFAFTHGRKGCLDGKIARQVADQLKIENFRFIDVDPHWLVDYAEKFVYLTDGMVDASPAILLGISAQYGLPPESTVFLNGIFGGPTNFGSSYFKLNDIVENLDHSEKLRRISFSLGGLSEDKTDSFLHPEFAGKIRNRYLPSIDEEFSGCLGVSPLFCNQKDVFFIRNRIFRYMNLVDCNRFIWHDHFALADDRLLEFFLKLPARLKPSRMFFIEYFKAKLPDLAHITYQGTGVDLYRKPSRYARKYQFYSNRIKYYIERLSGGNIRFYNPKNYNHYNQWYRSDKRIRNYYESILLDDRTYRRGYFDRNNIEFLLRQQRRGVNNIATLTSVLSFELFHRLFMDQ